MSPKILDQELLANREQAIIDAALELIAREGVSGLTIDKLVNVLPFSKGTLYNHFSGKEDLLTALCIQALQHLIDLFQRAATFDGNSRARVGAIGFAYMLHARLDPVEFMLVITAKTPAIREKTSQARRDEYQLRENQLLDIFMQVITGAIAAGDLHLPSTVTPVDAAFALWSNCFGTISLLQDNLERCAVRQELDMEQSLMLNCGLLLDSLGWQPLGQDPQPNLERMKLGLFQREYAQLQQALQRENES